MIPPGASVQNVPSISPHNAPSTITSAAAAICLIWYIFIAVVCTIGYVQIFRYYSRPPKPAPITDNADLLSVKIIRPVKGLEPELYACLASTFRQRYPPQKTRHRLCISSRSDPALPVLEQLLRDFPDHDAQILVEHEDEELHSGRRPLGPNPKVRNMSRAYREGEGETVWIVDCNVWVGPHTLGRMLADLRHNKFVHQLPLVVDVGRAAIVTGSNLNGTVDKATCIDQIQSGISAGQDSVASERDSRSWWHFGGGRLEEAFMSSSHAKFYTAINTVLIAPCIVGKSTMFKASHLNSLTDNQGIDYFSQNICEDHLIGDLLWKRKVPEEQGIGGTRLGRHAMCFGDLAIQPMRGVSVREYWERRVRWLRVRKFTVTLATLVEPGTESFLCSLYGAYAVTMLPFFQTRLGIPATWPCFALFWLLSVAIWCIVDWTLYQKLQSADSVHIDGNTPSFVRPPKLGRRRSPWAWLLAWLGREALALPIWLWAFWGGTKVEWRGKKFWVGMDMKVHETHDRDVARGPVAGRKVTLSTANGHKARQD